MKRVYLCCPSARPWEESWRWLLAWLERGYGASIWRDSLDDGFAKLVKESGYPVILLTGRYPGYAAATNACAEQLFHRDPDARWAVATGDDTLPDPTWHPDHIALQLEAYFGGTMGICQPTGDPFRDAGGRIIERIAGSPWLGKEWCRRGNGGMGPFHPGFTHMFGDQCLQETAQKLGIFLQRPDLSHEHRHFTRRGDDATWTGVTIPDHLKQWNTPEHWQQMEGLYNRLKADGFKECMPAELE